MGGIRIASRYAKSLLDLASEQGKLERAVDDIKLFQDATSNRDLLLMIKSPIIKADKKRSVFKAIFDGKVDEITSAFFDIIIRKGRESALPEICAEFINQYRQLKNITSATVTTAAPLDATQLAKIKTEMITLGLANGEVELETIVDENIIGGFVLQVKDLLYDASVKSKLANLKKEILDNRYIKSL